MKIRIWENEKKLLNCQNFKWQVIIFCFSSLKHYIDSIYYLEKTCPLSTLIKYPQCPVLIPSPLLQSTGLNITNHKLSLIMFSMRWSDHLDLYITKDFLYPVEDINKNLTIKSIIFLFHSQSIGLKTQSI